MLEAALAVKLQSNLEEKNPKIFENHFSSRAEPFIFKSIPPELSFSRSDFFLNFSTRPCGFWMLKDW